MSNYVLRGYVCAACGGKITCYPSGDSCTYMCRSPDCNDEDGCDVIPAWCVKEYKPRRKKLKRTKDTVNDIYELLKSMDQRLEAIEESIKYL